MIEWLESISDEEFQNQWDECKDGDEDNSENRMTLLEFLNQKREEIITNNEDL